MKDDKYLKYLIEPNIEINWDDWSIEILPNETKFQDIDSLERKDKKEREKEMFINNRIQDNGEELDD